MRIVDYKLMRPPLDEFNFVLVVDDERIRGELKKMGCSDAEISSMKGEKDALLNVLPVLTEKGYTFFPGKGFCQIKKRKE